MPPYTISLYVYTLRDFMQDERGEYVLGILIEELFRVYAVLGVSFSIQQIVDFITKPSPLACYVPKVLSKNKNRSQRFLYSMIADYLILQMEKN